MSWSKFHRPGRRTFWPCHQADCGREVGNFPTNACEECHLVFCSDHLFKVSVGTATLKLCKKCALERQPAMRKSD